MSELPQDFPSRDGDRSSLPSRDGDRSSLPSRDGDFPSRDGDRSSLPSRDGDLPSRDGDFPSRDCDRSSLPSRDGDFPSRDGDHSSLPSRDGDFPSRDGDRSSLPSRDGDLPSRDGDFPSRDGDRSSLPSRDGDLPSRDGDFPSRDGDRSSLPSRDGDFPSRDGDRSSLPSRDGDFPSRDGDRSSLPSRYGDLPSRDGDFPSRDGDRSSLPSRDGDRSSLPSRDGDFPSFGHMHNVLEGASYNWFELVEFVEEFTCDSASRLEEYLHSFYSRLVSSLEEPKSVALLEQSFKAFRASASPSAYLSRMAAALNGEVVSESDSDNADDYVGLLSIASPRAKKIIEKKRKALALRVRRAKAKAIASKNVLARKVTRKVKTVVDKFPGIGKTIETFVQDCNVGADAWRRTGVLTFDGNRHIKMKATFQRIRTHLEETYNHKFSYGTVVQLCVPRNLRHRAAKNYRGVAKVTCRRSRKGFELRYNPDSHWSRALYKGLNYIELTDGSDITIINRDDASGYRLDTLFTNRQHRTPAVQGHQALTTHTDYVNKYPSIIQTTSYNFTGTRIQASFVPEL